MEIKGKRNTKLQWLNYNIVNIYKSGVRTPSEVDVTHSGNFPPLLFSRVKSYATDSEAPLS